MSQSPHPKRDNPVSKLTRNREGPMERFFSERNIERYRRMLANPRDEAQRRMILKLLAEEKAQLEAELRAAGGNRLERSTSAP
jgi:hypothetical protein